MEALEAARVDDLPRQKAALAELEQAREECACVGGLLILMAIQHGGLVVQKKLGAVFGELARGAWHKALAAEARAAEALEQLDVMKERMKQLEKKVGARHPSRVG